MRIFPRNKAKDHVTVFELHTKRCIWEAPDNLTLHFDQIFLLPSYLAESPEPLEICFLQEPFILVRHRISLNLVHEVHCSSNNNNQQ